MVILIYVYFIYHLQLLIGYYIVYSDGICRYGFSMLRQAEPLPDKDNKAKDIFIACLYYSVGYIFEAG